MPKGLEPPTVTLAIHLIKKGLTAQDAIRAKSKLSRHSLKLSPEVTGELFVKTPPRRRPTWAQFFDGFVSESEFGWVGSSSAVLLVPIDERLFGITFGQGRYMLAPECSEDQFGLVVALNSIADGEFRSIDKKIFDAIARRTREQAGRFAAVREFGMDTEKDLLRAVTGRSSDEELGSLISGGDSLSVHIKTRITDLPDLLERYGTKSRQRAYRKKYPWIDQISPITNKELKRKLDSEMLSMIRARQLDQCWLAPPAMMDWTRDRGFAYGRPIKYDIVQDIHLKSFLETVKNPDAIEQADLDRRRIVIIGENDEPRDHWAVYRCLNCELEYKGDTYVLSDGRWYRVATDFVAQINQYYSTIPRFDVPLPEYQGGHEKDYNQGVVVRNDNFANLDRDLIQIGRDSIEFCDLFSLTKDLIHVKRYAGSGVLSHLFNQGLVSAEYFQMDEGVRGIVSKKLPAKFQIIDTARRPTPEEYRVVFAIISQSAGDLTLPFFSRVSARHVIKRLELIGYRVALAKISFSDAAKKLKQVRQSVRLQKAFGLKSKK